MKENMSINKIKKEAREYIRFNIMIFGKSKKSRGSKLIAHPKYNKVKLGFDLKHLFRRVLSRERAGPDPLAFLSRLTGFSIETVNFSKQTRLLWKFRFISFKIFYKRSKWLHFCLYIKYLKYANRNIFKEHQMILK